METAQMMVKAPFLLGVNHRDDFPIIIPDNFDVIVDVAVKSLGMVSGWKGKSGEEDLDFAVMFKALGAMFNPSEVSTGGLLRIEKTTEPVQDMCAWRRMAGRMTFAAAHVFRRRGKAAMWHPRRRAKGLPATPELKHTAWVGGSACEPLPDTCRSYTRSRPSSSQWVGAAIALVPSRPATEPFSLTQRPRHMKLSDHGC